MKESLVLHFLHDNQKYEIEKSGNILIPKYEDDDKSIDQLLEEFENSGSQSHKPIT